MTNKEAIYIINNRLNTYYCTDEDLQALDLAIKALMAYRDCRHCVHNIKVGNVRGCELGDCDFKEIENEVKYPQENDL